MMNKVVRLIGKEIQPIYTLLAAIIVGLPILCFGVVWNLLKPIFHFRKKGFKVLLKNYGLYWLRLIYQIWCVIKRFLNYISLSIDYLGNVVSGELLEDTISSRENTLFGDANTTISAAIGYEKKHGKTVKFGDFVEDSLSHIFEKNHCANAIELKEIVDKFKQERNINF